MKTLALVLVFAACGESPTSVSARQQLTSSSATALSGLETRRRVVSDTMTSLSVLVSHNTVICSAADYGAEFLKIIIPEIANYTLFNHQNTGAGGPCLGAGACDDGHDPTSLVDPNEPYVDTELRVLLTGEYELNHDEKTCRVRLKEELFATIRGVDFAHLRAAPLAERPYHDCLGIK